MADTEVLVPRSNTDLDRELVDRLRALSAADSASAEHFAPLRASVLEALIWLGAAVALWIAAAVSSV